MDDGADGIKLVPPNNIEAEQSLLGSLLRDNSALPRVLEILKGNEFYRDKHRQIFLAIVELFEANEPFDILTVSEQLKKKNKLESVGGTGYLAQLAASVSNAANAAAYARIVYEKYVLRKLIEIASRISTDAYEAGRPVDEIIDSAEKIIFDIAESKFQSSYFHIKDVVKESIELIEKLYERRELVTGVPSGYKDLDRLTAGFQPGDLVIIAGRPSMGKTAFALNIARNASIDNDVPVAFFSLEMSRQQLSLRLMSSEARVDSHRIRSGFLSQEESRKLVEAADIISNAKILIDDSPSLSALEIRAKARRMKAEHNIELLIVDYLQMMKGNSRLEQREQIISEISRSLKALAKELNIPVLALSQLNRNVELRTDKRPQLSDLREWGAIEQDADLIAFIYRDEVYNRESPDQGIAEIIIGKQRNGPTGKVKLAYISSYTRFENLIADPMAFG
ncbi:MAG TPA: replicative DNA helicase [Deltaproteobacteria bacterium]|nr:replicative DNA helicase [Deltaproteobacteria bacterium]